LFKKKTHIKNNVINIDKMIYIDAYPQNFLMVSNQRKKIKENFSPHPATYSIPVPLSSERASLN
jgi:hypothetical protein